MRFAGACASKNGAADFEYTSQQKSQQHKFDRGRSESACSRDGVLAVRSNLRRESASRVGAATASSRWRELSAFILCKALSLRESIQ